MYLVMDGFSGGIPCAGSESCAVFDNTNRANRVSLS